MYKKKNFEITRNECKCKEFTGYAGQKGNYT